MHLPIFFKSLKVYKMLIIFKTFIIYLFIVSCTYSPQPNNGKLPSESDDFKTLPVADQSEKDKALLSAKYEKQVQILMLPFAKYFSMIPDALDRGELKGKLDMLAHQAVMAEETLKEQGDSRDKAATYQLLLGLTFRVDTLESILVPDQKLVGQRSKRWMHILSLNTPAVVNLRKKVIAAGMTEHSFAKEIERLIQERNNRVGHANVPLPRLIKKKTIEGALRIMEITEDDAAVETLKILVAPVKGLDFEPSAATDPTDPATTDPTCQLINATDPTICERKGN